MAVRPLIPLADHYDGVCDHRSAYRNLHNVVLHGDHHDVGGDPSRKHEQHHPRTVDQLLRSLCMSLQP